MIKQILGDLSPLTGLLITLIIVGSLGFLNCLRGFKWKGFKDRHLNRRDLIFWQVLLVISFYLYSAIVLAKYVPIIHSVLALPHFLSGFIVFSGVFICLGVVAINRSTGFRENWVEKCSKCGEPFGPGQFGRESGLAELFASRMETWGLDCKCHRDWEFRIFVVVSIIIFTLVVGISWLFIYRQYFGTENFFIHLAFVVILAEIGVSSFCFIGFHIYRRIRWGEMA